MKKYVMLFTTLTFLGLAHAFPNVGRIAFRVVVLDERSGLPLKNVPVTAVFTDNPVHWGDDSVERVEHLLTDTKGMCRVVGTSNHGAASYVVEKMPGYHATSMVRYKATNEFSSIIPIPYRCEPYDCVYTTLLQRVERPVPLYVHRAILDGRRESVGGFDGTNAVLKFDFLVGDWLPPHGTGKYSDMTITTKLEIGEALNIWRSHKTTFYDFISAIELPGKGNGLVEKSVRGSNCGIRIRTAPESGYVSEKVMQFGRRKKNTSGPVIHPEYYTESDDDRCYCFRVRSRFDEKGNLVEAYYGKIYGDFRFRGTDKSGFNGASFLYYLNPTSLDRNLEWDMKNNLCKKPLRMDYESIGVRYREP